MVFFRLSRLEIPEKIPSTASQPAKQKQAMQNGAKQRRGVQMTETGKNSDKICTNKFTPKRKQMQLKFGVTQSCKYPRPSPLHAPCSRQDMLNASTAAPAMEMRIPKCICNQKTWLAKNLTVHGCEWVYVRHSARLFVPSRHTFARKSNFFVSVILLGLLLHAACLHVFLHFFSKTLKSFLSKIMKQFYFGVFHLRCAHTNVWPLS